MPETVVQLGWLVPLGLLCLGLLVGSFLNVVIYRLPLMMEARWRRDCCIGCCTAATAGARAAAQPADGGG